MKELNEGDVTYPFGVLPFPPNRHNKHAAEKEVDTVCKLIGKVQNEFLEEVFNNDNISYSSSYEYSLVRFTKTVKYIKEKLKPKYIELDPQYFALTFRPLEK